MVTIAGVNMKRRLRRPVHTFNLSVKPFVIQPFLLAPVLAGDTMANLSLQSRVVTDPVANPLIGWWKEYYIFYVKVTDLVGVQTSHTDISDIMQTMLMDPADTAFAAYKASATVPLWYLADGSQQYVVWCLRRVIDTYFRAGDESWETAAGLLESASYLAHISTAPGWWESLVPTASLTDTEDTELLDISAGTTLLGSDDKLMASEVEEALRRWQLASMNNLTTQTWDEYLATYGVRQPQTELHMPELIRSIKQWQYPSNTIDPTNGTPRSALSWSIAERADKNRYFKEPGWIFGVTLTRPKVYSARQLGSLAGFMDNAYKWAPPILWSDKKGMFGQFSDTADAPLDPATITAPFTADMRDLLDYGDQFLNYDPTTADRNTVALPNAAVTNKRYVAEADINNLFVADAVDQVKEDGIVNLAIHTAVPAGSDMEGTGASNVVVP